MRAGYAAEFENPHDLLAAIDRLLAMGYRDVDAFTPYPVHGLEERLHLGRSRLNWLIFPIGMAGALGAFFLQWYCNAWSYPINVGGRPGFAIPAFIPITFETGILATGVGAFVALIWTLGLPHLSHPLFAVEDFDRASIDRFWLAVGDGDPSFDGERTPRDLGALGAMRVAPFGRRRS
jgi:hypothetical protein